MEVYALIGASGTGKSHNANSVMEDYGIELMIDDGLLIKDGKKWPEVRQKQRKPL